VISRRAVVSRLGFVRSLSVVALLASSMATTIVSLSTGRASAAPVGARFVSLPPTRILDTRIGVGAPRQPVAAGASIDVQITGALVPAGATAVAFNLTATGASGAGFVTAWPAGTAPPTVSNLNLPSAGSTVANLVVVALPTSGKVSLFASTGTDMITDMAGYWLPEPSGVSSGGRFVTQRPARILDTREGLGAPATKVAAKGTIEIAVAGKGGVPSAGASAAVLVVTATSASDPGFVTAFPTGAALPTASVLNLKSRGDTVPNLVIVPLGTGGRVSLFSSNGTHLIVDVAGWFTDASEATSSDGLFVPLAPVRALDSRSKTPFGKLWPGQRNDLVVTGQGQVPASGVSAVITNVTSTGAANAGFVTVWPAATAQPTASNLNTPGGADVASLSFVAVGSTGAFSLFSDQGTGIIADVSGYFLGNELPAEPGVPTTPPPPPAPPLRSRPNVPAAVFSCNAGPSMDQIERVDINPGVRTYLDNLPGYVTDQASSNAVAYTIMANSGPLPARVALEPEFERWLNIGGVARSRQAMLNTLQFALHETIHWLQRGTCALTGPSTGYATPRVGFLQSDLFGDVNSRIDAIAATVTGTSDRFALEYAHTVADTYLAGAVGAQNFVSQMWEINAYVLSAEWGAGMNDTFGVPYLGDTTGNDDTMSIKFHQLARYLNRAQSNSALWAQMQSLGLPQTVADHWNLGVKSWQVYKRPIRQPTFMWDLAFGPDVGPVVAFTNGAAGVTAPPRPAPSTRRAGNDQRVGALSSDYPLTFDSIDATRQGLLAAER
jgi:hypothetical protein